MQAPHYCGRSEQPRALVIAAAAAKATARDDRSLGTRGVSGDIRGGRVRLGGAAALAHTGLRGASPIGSSSAGHRVRGVRTHGGIRRVCTRGSIRSGARISTTTAAAETAGNLAIAVTNGRRRVVRSRSLVLERSDVNALVGQRAPRNTRRALCAEVKFSKCEYVCAYALRGAVAIFPPRVVRGRSVAHAFEEEDSMACMRKGTSGMR